MSIRRRRNTIEIYSEILRVALSPATKTMLVYRCNLNFSRLESYLSFLVVNGLIEQVEDERGKILYQTTEKGRMFIKDYERVKSLISSAIHRIRNVKRV